jgi:DNA-binding transcriptional LysR family regulator
VNNGDMMRDAAIADLGIALLPSFAAAAAIAAGELTIIDIGRPAQDEFIFMAHPEGRRASAKLKALVTSLRQAFGNPPYWDSKLARSLGKRARSASATRPRP